MNSIDIVKSLQTLTLSAVVAIALTLLPANIMYATDGHILQGVGPVNQGMGGASTGACLDIMGSVSWNPACTSSFNGTILEGSLEYFIPDRTISSSVQAGAFGPGFPPAGLSGSTVSETNAAFLPSFAIVRRKPDSRNAYHFGFIGVGGFGVEYPENTDFSNPILTPQPPDGLGFGRIDSNYILMKMPVGFSRWITDSLSVGVSAVPALSLLRVSPAPFAPPVVTEGSSFPYYLNASDNSSAIGIGGNVGLLYKASEKVSLGVSYHTPVWFQGFEWQSEDRIGQIHELTFRMDVPAIVTMGVGITPLEGTELAFDVRWIDYENTRGFKGQGFGPDGAVVGFGWESVWAYGGGIQQNITERLRIRGGYNYSQNPIRDELSFFNSPAPAIVQHHLSAGLSYEVKPGWDVHGAYYHAFNNEISGPFVGSSGPVPGTSVSSQLKEDSVSIGFTRRF